MKKTSDDFYGGGPSRHVSQEKKQIVDFKRYDDQPKGKFMRLQPTITTEQNDRSQNENQTSSVIEVNEQNDDPKIHVEKALVESKNKEQDDD